MNKKPVVQGDPMGCGVACSAFLLNKTYPQTLKLFPTGKKKANGVGFFGKELAHILGTEYKCGFVKRNQRKLYLDGTVVFLRRHKKYPFGHYLARLNGKWMDPWINFPNPERKAGFRKRLPDKPVFLIFRTW